MFVVSDDDFVSEDFCEWPGGSVSDSRCLEFDVLHRSELYEMSARPRKVEWPGGSVSDSRYPDCDVLRRSELFEMSARSGRA